MKGKRLIGALVFGIIVSLALITSSYSAEPDQEEQEFENIVKEHNDIFSSFNIEAEDQQVEGQKHQQRFEAVIENLNSFIVKYPHSRYVDDAVYILASCWIGQPEKHIQKLRIFLTRYPNASLEDWTLNNLVTLMVLTKEVGIINVAQMDISISLYDLGEYEESAKEASKLINNLGSKNLTDKAYRFLSLSYFYLMKDYEALGNNKKVKEICKEAIERFPDSKTKENFIKKLQELD